MGIDIKFKEKYSRLVLFKADLLVKVIIGDDYSSSIGARKGAYSGRYICQSIVIEKPGSRVWIGKRR